MTRNPVSFDILNLYNQFPQIGLQDNMIYDILPVVPAAVNDAVVNATYFNVDCGALPRGAQSGQADLSADGDITWTFEANFTKPALTVMSGVGLKGRCTLTQELYIYGGFHVPTLTSPSVLESGYHRHT